MTLHQFDYIRELAVMKIAQEPSNCEPLVCPMLFTPHPLFLASQPKIMPCPHHQQVLQPLLQVADDEEDEALQFQQQFAAKSLNASPSRSDSASSSVGVDLISYLVHVRASLYTIPGTV